jgi:hypothetical protein
MDEGDFFGGPSVIYLFTLKGAEKTAVGLREKFPAATVARRLSTPEIQKFNCHPNEYTIDTGKTQRFAQGKLRCPRKRDDVRMYSRPFSGIGSSYSAQLQLPPVVQ